MSNIPWILVRKDADLCVWAEHTNCIHPRDLSRRLSDAFGEKQFKISLRKNIYIIYVDMKRRENDENRDPRSDDEEDSNGHTIGPETYEERLQDIKLAEKKLSSRRLYGTKR